MKQKHLLVAAFATISTLCCAQQVPDTAFTYPNPQPHYALGQGPVVWLDEAHYNFHTLDGRYAPFGKVLRQDGYQVEPNRQELTPTRLANCRVLVIANALDSVSNNTWELPNESAFNASEIAAVNAWVKTGGSLFLIADHMPFAGSAQALAASFGVEMLNCFALDNNKRSAEQFYRGNKSMFDTPLTQQIDTIVTFTGSAFHLPEGAQPVLALVDYAILEPKVAWKFDETTKRSTSEGLYQLGYFQFGKGRVVISGEAAMFSAQLAGQKQNRMGMNQPAARQNGQLLLNIMNWLSGS